MDVSTKVICTDCGYTFSVNRELESGDAVGCLACDKGFAYSPLIPEIENGAVNHPSHYNQGKIEVIDFIEDQKLGFNLGNAIKYISRGEHKGKAVEDLEKALWYLTREISNRKGTLVTTTEKNFSTANNPS